MDEVTQLRAALDEMFELARRNICDREWGGENVIQRTEAQRDEALIRKLIQSAGVRRVSDFTVQAYREYLTGFRCSSRCPICGIDTPHTHAASQSDRGAE